VKWKITYAGVREVELTADNINCAFKRADEDIKEGEKIVRVKVKR
jgi:hypothetical protein